MTYLSSILAGRGVLITPKESFGHEHVETLAALTNEQVDRIKIGWIVTDASGNRWSYTGSGNKRQESSYVKLSDVTPEISDIVGLQNALNAKVNNSDITTAGWAMLTAADAQAQAELLTGTYLQPDDINAYGNIYARGDISTTSEINAYNINSSGDLIVEGNATLGDNIGDSVTIHAATLTAPNATNTSPDRLANVGALDTRYAPVAHTHTAAQISDATDAGRAMLTAADAQAQADLLLGTNLQPHDITASGDINANGSINADNVNANGSITADNVNANYDITANGSINAYGSISVASDVTLGGASGATLTIYSGTIFAPNATNTSPDRLANVGALDTRYAPVAHTHTSAQISDSTPAGRAMLTAASHQAQAALLADNYIYVSTASGAALVSAYNTAKTRTSPNGIPRSAHNRVTILLAPGTYDLGNTGLTLDGEYVDIIGLGKPEDTLITSAVTNGNGHTIMQTAHDVRLQNLTLDNTGGTKAYSVSDASAYSPVPLSLDGNLSLDRATGVITKTNHGLKNGEQVSFATNGGSSLAVKKLYFVRDADVDTFKLSNTAGGPALTFGSGIVNITVQETRLFGVVKNVIFRDTGGWSTQFEARFGGTFENCTGGNSSFGGGGTASGTFEGCTGGLYSFGGYGTVSGTFRGCTGGNSSFGGGGTASGTFEGCTGGLYSFGGGGTASGTFEGCTGGLYSFGGNGTASGTFEGCTGGLYSFGGNGTASGTFRQCRLTVTNFNLSNPAKFINCIDGEGNLINKL